MILGCLKHICAQNVLQTPSFRKWIVQNLFQLPKNERGIFLPIKIERTKQNLVLKKSIQCDGDEFDHDDDNNKNNTLDVTRTSLITIILVVMMWMIMKMVMISMILVVMMSRRLQLKKLDQDSRILAKEEKISEKLVLYYV